MAKISTRDGLILIFDPAAVTIVADRDADTGAPGTNVYGLQPGPQRITLPVNDFLNSLGIATNFAQLTRPDGSPVWVNAKAIKIVRTPVQGEYVAGVQSVLLASNTKQGVMEAIDDVGQALRQHGGTV